MLAPTDLDPKAIRLQFDRRAAPAAGREYGIARAGFILREVERRLFERLDPIRVDPRVVVDLGCGHGSGAIRLAQRFARARVVGIDGSARMACEASRLHAPRPAQRVASWLASRVPGARAAGMQAPQFVVSDAHRLALGAQSVDLIWSNLAWHWFARPVEVIAECHRVLRGGGLLQFSSFGVDTLREIRAMGGRVAEFPDLHDIGDALVAAGFADPVLDAERITVTWDSPDRMLGDLRSLGGNALVSRARGVSTRAARERWLAALGSLAGTDGRAALTFEIVYGHAWCPAPRRLPRGYSPISFVENSKGR